MTKTTKAQKEIDELKREINKIKKRNKKVEADKAWETCWTRRITIILSTYAIIVIFFYFAQLPKPFINSIVPSLAFAISTLTLPFFKKRWINKIQKNN